MLTFYNHFSAFCYSVKCNLHLTLAQCKTVLIKTSWTAAVPASNFVKCQWCTHAR